MDVSAPNRSLTAEQSVIGSIMIDDRCAPALMRLLDGECFTDSSLRHCFEAARQLWLDKRPIDPVTVLGVLGGSKGYEDLIRSAMMLTPTAANCEEYARILVERKELREIQAACFEIATATMDLEDARAKLSEAARLLVTGHDTIRRFSYLELVTRFCDRQNDETPRDWLDFGIEAMNKRVHVGLGDFVIIGAYSSVGKTAFALQLARSVSSHGTKVGFYSYETNEEHAGDRLIANAAGISLQAIKEKQLKDEDWTLVCDEGERAGRYAFDLIESARLRVEDIRADILANGYKVVFLDYVQIIPGGKNGDERKDIVAATSMALHLMCQELGVTIIALSQVTLPERKANGSRRWVSMQDLRESKQLLQDAETVLLLDYEDPLDRDSDRVLIVDKNKDGPVGHFFLHFRGDTMRFSYRDDSVPDSGTGSKSRRHQGPKYEQSTFEDLDDDGYDDEIPF